MARKSRILGPDGEPVDLDALFGPPRAGPTLAGVRSPISGHPAEGLTPARLAAIHRAAAQGDARAWLELAEDIEERDAHYAAVLGTRRRGVAQLPVRVEAAGEDRDAIAHAAFVREWLAEGVLDGALFDLLDAVGKGFSVLEIEWHSTPERVAPRALEWRPQRWFALADHDGETLLIEDVTRVPLPAHKFLVHRHRAKSGLTIRSGLARVASWSWMYKAFNARDWAVFTQNYGQPIRVGKYHPGASETDRAALWRAVANIAGDCAAIVPQGMEIDFVEVKSALDGAKLYEARADWLDRQVSKLVLGQTTTTDAVSGGHAVAREHRLVQEDIERADARMLAATLNAQLVPQIVAFNFGPQARYPRLVIGRPDETPIGELVEAMAKLGPLGLTAKAQQLRQRLGLDDPDGDDELVGGRAATPSPDASGVDPRVGARGQALSPPGRGEGPRAPARPPPRPSPAGHPAPPAGRGPRRGGGSPTAPPRVTLHGVEDAAPEILDPLTARLAREAQGALDAQLAAVEAEIAAATDMADLAERLERLVLDPETFAEAMARGLALAHMAGRAALLDETGDGST